MEIFKIGNNQSYKQCSKALENDLRRLKCENEKLILNNYNDMSALLTKKKFIWVRKNSLERWTIDVLGRKIERSREIAEMLVAWWLNMRKNPAKNL